MIKFLSLKHQGEHQNTKAKNTCWWYGYPSSWSLWYTSDITKSVLSFDYFEKANGQVKQKTHTGMLVVWIPQFLAVNHVSVFL